MVPLVLTCELPLALAPVVPPPALLQPAATAASVNAAVRTAATRTLVGLIGLARPLIVRPPFYWLSAGALMAGRGCRPPRAPVPDRSRLGTAAIRRRV